MPQLPPNAYHYLAGDPRATRRVYDIPAIVSHSGLGPAIVRLLARRQAADVHDLPRDADILDVAA